MATPTTVIANCPLCGSCCQLAYATFPQISWSRCDCDLIYKRKADPQLMVEAVYQDASYFKAGEDLHAHSYNQRTRRRVAKSRRQILDALNHTEPGPVLDIGCSLGYALEAARDLGLPAHGIDVAPFAVQSCRSKGFLAEIGSLNRIPFPDNSFAVVLMKHVLEHTPDPRTALLEARRVLLPGGALFIAVPNAEYRKAVRDPQRSRFYRPDSPGGVEHYVYYSPTTLSRLLADCGYCVAHVNPHFIRRHSPFYARSAQGLAAPFRLFAGALATSLGLRKEFSIVAVSEGFQ